MGHFNKDKVKKYLNVAYSVSQFSKDPSTKVGAVLVDHQTHTIVGTGYNGAIRNADDDIIPTIRPDKYSYFIHAEQNLIYNCAKNGIKTNDQILFSTHSPCEQCVRALYQAGIKTIYFSTFYPNKEEFLLVKRLLDVEVNLIDLGEFYSILLHPRRHETNW